MHLVTRKINDGIGPIGCCGSAYKCLNISSFYVSPTTQSKSSSKKYFQHTSPRSLPSVPSKSMTSVQGSMPTQRAIQIPFVVCDLENTQFRQLTPTMKQQTSSK